MVAQLLRFSGIGGLATVVHILFALIVQSVWSVPDLWANFAGFCAALLVSYAGHGTVTFRVDMRHRDHVPRFLAVALLGLSASSATVWAVTRAGGGFALAMTVVAVVVPAATYLALRFWVFAGNHRRSTDRWGDIALAAVIAGVVLLLFWGRMINHDTAWYLVATGKWLDGAVLYRDLIEINPPLNFYLTVPAIALSELFGISGANATYLLLSLVIFVVLAWVAEIAREDIGLCRWKLRVLLTGLTLILVLPSLNNMGQREQVLVILMTPWLIGQLAPRPPDRRKEALRASLAAVGMCLKPYFVVFPLAVTLWHMMRARSRQPAISVSNLIFLGVGVGYVFAVALIHPLYFREIVPVGRLVYGAYDAPAPVIFLFLLVPISLFAVGGLSVLIVRRACPGAVLLAVMSLAGLVSYVWQGTGFGYHAIPFMAFGLLACLWIVLDGSAPGAATLAAVVAVILSVLLADRGVYRNPWLAEIVEVGRDHGPVAGLMVVTTNVSAGPPVATALGSDWISRYPANWLVPGAVNALARTDCSQFPSNCEALRKAADTNRRDNIADILLGAPDLLVIDKMSGYFDVPDFSWYDFLRADRRYDEVMSRYRLVESTRRFDYWRALDRDRRLEEGEDVRLSLGGRDGRHSAD